MNDNATPANLHLGTFADFGTVRTIHAIIEEQARRRPHMAAVTGADGCGLTYGELNSRANQLAHWLIKRGIGPERLVGILLDRSFDAIIAILGILKAGGAYVPLDPAYPQERRDYMLEDAGMQLVLTTRRIAMEQAAMPNVHLVMLEEMRYEFDAESTQNPDVDVRPENLCYVIYTSGSTGRPKGVMIEHRNLLHSIGARVLYYPDPVDAYILVFSLAFDGSVVGIFWTLCTGGRLILPGDGTDRDPVKLAGQIERQRVTHLIALPSLYRLLLEQSTAQQLATMRVIVVAGEECLPAVISDHRTRMPHASLYNEYGPTEGTIWCTVHPLRNELLTGRISIGKAISGMQVYVVDLQGELAAPGEQGEIWIGGLGIARGYINKPDLTAEKFIPDTFNGRQGGRLYRTGDLGRWRADGNLEFLGRVDHQVKVRGFRIELGEIETCLNGHAAVLECAVIAHTGKDGDRRLVAYLVYRNGHIPTITDIRAHLSERLPEYMVPSLMVPLAALPVLPNGKVDRGTLPDPLEAAANLARAYEAPRGETEAALARIWQELLGVSPVGRGDNFFELGGHSLLATRLIWKIRQEWNLEIPVRFLFEAPVLAEFAGRVAAIELLSKADSPAQDPSEEIVF